MARVDGFRLPQDLPRSWKRHFETNVESDPEYPSWAPASVSLVGFSHEYAFSRWVQEDLKPKGAKRVGLVVRPDHEIMLKRWKKIEADGGLGRNSTERAGHQQVMDLVTCSP
jgi:hypothetical protein